MHLKRRPVTSFVRVHEHIDDEEAIAGINVVTRCLISVLHRALYTTIKVG